MKKIKQEIKRLANEIEVPNVLLKIKETLPENNTLLPKKHRFKLVFSSLLVSLVAVFVLLFFFQPETPPHFYSKDVKKMAISIATLSNFYTPDEMNMKFNNSLEYDEAFEKIHEYTKTAEEFINKDSIKIEVLEVNGSEYNYKMIVNFSSLNLGEDIEFYFNETKKGDSTIINGQLIKGNKTFKVNGEIENDSEETETKYEIFLNNLESIEISEEREQNEREYTVSFYENKKLIKEVNIEYEKSNNDKYNVEIEVIELEEEFCLEFYFSNNFIYCETEFNDEELKVKIEVKDDYYIYKYKNYEKKIKK